MKPMNELKTKSYDQKGFSLVEIMIALGILATISLGVMKISQMMNRSTKQMNQQLDSVQLATRISGAIRNKDACRYTFRNVAPALNQPATNSNAGIRDHQNNIMIPVGSVFGDITVERIFFYELDPDTFETVSIEDPDSPGTYNPRRKRSGVVRAQLKKGVSQFDEVNQRNTVGTLSMVQDFHVTYYLDDAGRIESCYTQDAQYVEAACGAMGGVIDDGLCRGIDIRDRDGTPGPATNNAAVFRGNVVITSVNSVSNQQNLTVGGNAVIGIDATVNRDTRINRDARIIRNLTVGGNSTLGNASTDRVFVTGQICLNGTAGANCISTWRVRPYSCVLESRICTNERFVAGVYETGGTWVLRCCTARVK